MNKSKTQVSILQWVLMTMQNLRHPELTTWQNALSALENLNALLLPLLLIRFIWCVLQKHAQEWSERYFIKIYTINHMKKSLAVTMNKDKVCSRIQNISISSMSSFNFCDKNCERFACYQILGIMNGINQCHMWVFSPNKTIRTWYINILH